MRNTEIGLRGLTPVPVHTCGHVPCSEILEDGRRLYCSPECKALHYAIGDWGCHPKSILTRLVELYWPSE